METQGLKGYDINSEYDKCEISRQIRERLSLMVITGEECGTAMMVIVLRKS